MFPDGNGLEWVSEDYLLSIDAKTSVEFWFPVHLPCLHIQAKRQVRYIDKSTVIPGLTYTNFPD